MCEYESDVTLLAPEHVAGDITENLLGWIGHLGAKKTQRLEALADGVDVGHSHKHHLTVGIVFCRREGGRETKQKISGSRNFLVFQLWQAVQTQFR